MPAISVWHQLGVLAYESFVQPMLFVWHLYVLFPFVSLCYVSL